MWNLFKRTPDTTMQTVQPVDPAIPTVDEMDKVAGRWRREAEKWRQIAANTDDARIRAIGERDAYKAELDRRKQHAMKNLRQFRNKPVSADTVGMQ